MSRWHRKVVEKGHLMGPLMAQSLVGFAYHYGVGRSYCIGEGVPVDKAAGVDWYRKAAARPRRCEQAFDGRYLFGTMNLTMNFTPPKRRFWKTEQTFPSTFSKHFSRV